jgi:prephenate dehydratase
MERLAYIAGHAVMAIENSIAGSLLPNYVLLERHRFWIEAELRLRIELCLLALPGQKLRDLRHAQSHPVAILQSAEFLRQHPWLTPIEAADTAESAREIRERGRVGIAAIASRLAAKEYGLKVFASKIESGELSYTRFLVLRRRARGSDATLVTRSRTCNKLSLRFEVSSRRGSLARALQALADAGWSGTKIQSVPIARKPGIFSIHLDAVREGRAGLPVVAVLRALKPHAQRLALMGAYRSAR